MLSFRLPEQFTNEYATKDPRFGFNGLGEVVYLRTYSRPKTDGTQETWPETCARVINGMYSTLKDHCLSKKRPWNEEQALRSAKEAYDRLFFLKWSPSGRGLWMMGTPFVHERGISEGLQNCAFCTTDKLYADKGTVFEWFMEMLMLGVGVGSDIRGAGKVIVYNKQLSNNTQTVVIEDSREGWAKSVGLLVSSYISDLHPYIEFDYSLIRPKGQPIRGFGGIASGPEPLKQLHEDIRSFMRRNAGSPITSRTIADIFNAIGRCVIAGNVRRSAEILLGDPSDKDFVNLKNYDLHPERAEIGWTSNNTILANIGMDYRPFAERIKDNGEPGFIWLENVNNFGMMNGVRDTNDWATGTNPCGEQPLEHKELCNLVELYPTRNDDMYDFARSIKFAYLYAKTVTLLNEKIRDKDSRDVMMRNRRIGLSMTGITQFAARHGTSVLREWATYGSAETDRYDRVYSHWLDIPLSVRKRTVKPSGTVSLLAGVTPGVHFPEDLYYIRRIRISSGTDLEQKLRELGYHIEADVYSTGTSVVSFPVFVGDGVRSVKNVSIWEQLELAAFMQQYWSDNSVSVTVTIPANTTTDEIVAALNLYQHRLKSVSMLPATESGAYQQMPYEGIDKKTYEQMLSLLDNSNAINQLLVGSDRTEDKYCDTDVCAIDFTKPKAS